MTPDISERSFEDAIECALLATGPDACPDTPVARETAPGYGDATPGGYRRRDWREYDRALCLIPRDVLDFIHATQPREWDRRTNRHVQAASAVLLMREARAVEDGGGTPCRD